MHCTHAARDWTVAVCDWKPAALDSTCKWAELDAAAKRRQEEAQKQRDDRYAEAALQAKLGSMQIGNPVHVRNVLIPAPNGALQADEKNGLVTIVRIANPKDFTQFYSVSMELNGWKKEDENCWIHSKEKEKACLDLTTSNRAIFIVEPVD